MLDMGGGVQSASITFLSLARLLLKWRLRDTRGAVAQLGERLICIQEVAGSIPTSSTSLFYNGKTFMG